LKYEALSMSISSSIEAPETSDIMDFLSLITPEKIQWWGMADQSQVLVNLQPPFNLLGFNELNDADLVEEDIESILNAIRERFNLEKAVVFGLSGHQGDFNGIILSPGEARLLYEGITRGSFEAIRYVYVFSGSDLIQSIFRVKVPVDSKISDVVSFLKGNGRIDVQEEYTCIFNPLSHRLFNPEESIGPETAYIAISDEELRLDSAGFFSRPSTRRKPTFRRVTPSLDSRRPCNNCLICSSICPAGLSPSILFHFAQAGSEDLDALGADLCFRCGLCTFVCPSNIPLCEGIGGIDAHSL